MREVARGLVMEQIPIGKKSHIEAPSSIQISGKLVLENQTSIEQVLMKQLLRSQVLMRTVSTGQVSVKYTSM